MRLILLLMMLAALTLLSSQQAFAGLTETQSQLERVQARIDTAEKNLQHKNQSALNISRELAVIRRTLKQIDKRIHALKKEFNQLHKESLQQQARINKSRKHANKLLNQLRKRLVALYKEGDVGPLKILFSADSVTEMVQQYQYLSRILQYDKKLLAEYRQAIEHQQQQLSRLDAIKKEKGALLEKEKQQRQVAAKGRQLQSRLLKQVQRDKNKLANELGELKANATRLKKLIAELRRSDVGSSTSQGGNSSFGRGKLNWPVKGHVLIGFGQQRDKKLGTYYESNGLEIATSPGTPVYAVAAGKVVFANYFKGYGNLYILSHPGGYHTLYAQIDTMIKELGDTVSAGDLLGKSGSTGRESIYFEIRVKGSPVNPMIWLKKR